LANFGVCASRTGAAESEIEERQVIAIPHLEKEVLRTTIDQPVVVSWSSSSSTATRGKPSFLIELARLAALRHLYAK